MKSLFFLIVILSGSQAALVAEKSTQTCKIASLLPNGIPTGGMNLGSPGTDIPNTPDPLKLQNTTVSLQGENISGNYSLCNGVISGLSTLATDYSFHPITRRFALNATLTKGTLTGDYEIIDGRANLTGIGAHRFHGAGPLHGSIEGVVGSVGFLLNIDSQTQYLSVNDLKLDFNFNNASFVAENLIMNDDKVDWEAINKIIKPLFDLLWGSNKDKYTQLIEKRIDYYLEGCTIMDLLQLLTPPKPKPPQQ